MSLTGFRVIDRISDMTDVDIAGIQTGYVLIYNAITSKWEVGEMTGGTGGTSIHSGLTGLDYASAGHTGFEPTLNKGDLTETGSNILTIIGGVSGVIGDISIEVSSASLNTDGFLTSGDYATFLAKQNNLGYVPESGLTFTSPLSRLLNEVSIDLSEYLTILDASTTYQPSGNYLTSYTETDPLWSAASGNYSTTIQANALYYPLNSNPAGYLTSFVETDPIWSGVSGLYSTTLQANALYYPLSSNPSGYVVNAYAAAMNQYVGTTSSPHFANGFFNGTLQITGDSAPATGVGWELGYSYNRGIFRAYDRNTGHYKPGHFSGETFSIYVGDLPEQILGLFAGADGTLQFGKYTTNSILVTTSSNGTVSGIVNNSANWDAAYTYRVVSATGTLPLTLGLSSNALSVSMTQAGASSSGWLSSTDWNVFNNKQNAGNYYSVGGDDVAVTDGGTGKSSWTQYLIPYADTTTSFSQIPIGTSGQVLTSNGAGYVASFQTKVSGPTVQYYRAGTIYPSTTSGCAAVSRVQIDPTNNRTIMGMAFDGTANEYAEFETPIPSNWGGSDVKYRVYWIPATGALVGSGVVWNMYGVSFSSTDTMVSVSGTVKNVSGTVATGTYQTMHITPWSTGLTILNATTGDMAYFAVFRTPGHASDMVSQDAYLLGIDIDWSPT